MRCYFAWLGWLCVALVMTPGAAAQTWDGGGINDNFNTAANWNPNAVPANNGTANLIFGGITRLTPVVNLNYDVNGITFNTTAGSFDILQLNNSTLTVRGGGITKDDVDQQRFFVPVNFATNSSITASSGLASGNLIFSGGVGLGTSAVTVSGNSQTTIAFVSGTGLITKNGSARLFLGVGGGSILQYDLTVAEGTVEYYNATPNFGAGSAIALNDGALVISNVDLILSSGAQFTKADATIFRLTSGHTMLIQTGADANFTGTYITDDATYRVTGTGSTFTLQDFEIQNGDVEVLNGGELIVGGSVVIGPTGTLTVNGGILTIAEGQPITNDGGINFNGEWVDREHPEATPSLVDTGFGVAVRVPTLRNLVATAPYLHDGRFAGLDAVLDHYERMAADSHADERLRRPPLTTSERDDLKAFLLSLTDEP